MRNRISLGVVCGLLAVSLSSCVNPYASNYPSNNGGHYRHPSSSGGYYDDDYYRRQERERQREEQRELDQERRQLDWERERLERERDQQRALDEANRYRPPPAPPPPRQSRPNPPPEVRDRCPSGFSPSEDKCTSEERKHGCKDMRLPSGLGCVHR